MTDYREILRLRSLGINHSRIAQSMGIARPTREEIKDIVREVLQESGPREEQAEVDRQDAGIAALFVGRFGRDGIGTMVVRKVIRSLYERQ